MRIGNAENFLTIESAPIGAGHVALKFKAAARVPYFKFNAAHKVVMIDSAAATLARFAEFKSLKADRIEFELSEGGWLRFSRDIKGYITVRYRLVSGEASAAVEGKLMVEGEFANEFCREFEKLLKVQNQS